jgi:hypothetical protein
MVLVPGQPGQTDEIRDQTGMTLKRIRSYSVWSRISRSRISGHEFPNLDETLAYEKRADEAIPLFETMLKNAAKSEGVAFPDAHYQYAVSLTILGRHDEAFHHLQQAVDVGFADARRLTSDDDLKPLHNDPRFQGLLDQIKKKSPASK